MNVTYEYSALVTTGAFVVMTLLTIRYALNGSRRVLLPYIAMLFVFTGAQYGALDADRTFYSRGGGVFFLSLVNIFLLMLFLYCLVRYKAAYRAFREPKTVIVPLFAIVAMVSAYFLFGLLSAIPIENIVSRYGLLNVVNLFMLFMMLKWVMRGDAELKAFLRVFVAATSFMAVYGLIRWGLFGGDPANYYRNFVGQAAKLTYFDMSQGVLFAVLFVLLYERVRSGRGTRSWKIFYYFVMAASLANILLSYRRAIWGGFALVLMWIFVTSRPGRKVLIAGLAMGLIAIGSVVYQARFDESYKSRGAESIVSDITTSSGELDVTQGRFAELYYAILVANKSALIGMGPWGINQPRVTPQKDGDFVHSSMVHVYIKLGLMGLVPYIVLLVSYPLWWIRARGRNWFDSKYRMVGDAFFCGFLQEIPDILFGTPFIVFRHSQILAILLVLPYICYRLDCLSRIRSDVATPALSGDATSFHVMAKQ